MEKEKVLNLFLQSKVVPLFYESDPLVARQLVDACYLGGARVIEFTNRGDQAGAVFKDMLAYSKVKYPDLALGVGSIARVDQAKEFLTMGAHFLISPFLDEEVAKFCAENKMFWTGGCATLTEMNTAHKMGVTLMKAFPWNILGPDFIKAAKAPCPWLKIMPTGGVKPERDNLEAWFNAGAVCVGMGSQLFVKTPAGAYDYRRISDLLRDSISIVKNFQT